LSVVIVSGNEAAENVNDGVEDFYAVSPALRPAPHAFSESF
jgi:hypothetical protein